MSKVNISIVRMTNTTGMRGTAQIEDCETIGVSEEIASSGTSQTTTLRVDTTLNGASDTNTLFWRIANMGTDHIDVAFGNAPAATATAAATGWRFDYDNEDSGPFQVAETITFTSPAGTADIAHLVDNGDDGTIVIEDMATGSTPTDNSGMTGGTSNATGDVGGDVARVTLTTAKKRTPAGATAFFGVRSDYDRVAVMTA